MRGDFISKVGCGAWLLAALFFVLLFVSTCFQSQSPLSPVSDNDTILKEYVFRFQRNPQKFYFVMSVFRNTKYDGALWTEYDHENYKYILRSDTGDVGKAFPYLDATLSHYFADYADVLYKDSVFIIGPRYNRNADSVGVVYVHSYKTDTELLSYFDSYLFYDNQMDAGRGKWLYRLDDYWCICSPAREGVLKEMKYE